MTGGEQSHQNFVAECAKAEVERRGEYIPPPTRISSWAEKTGRCLKHVAREQRPPLCNICARITVERSIVERVVDALLAAGHLLNVDNGEDVTTTTVDRDYILRSLFQTDDEHLISYKHGRIDAWVRFVYGNGGFDVISDYTTNLEPIIAPIMSYADSLS